MFSNSGNKTSRNQLNTHYNTNNNALPSGFSTSRLKNQNYFQQDSTNLGAESVL